MSVPLLQVRGVSKSFSTSQGTRTILKDIDLTLSEGEFVCVVGYSGSGKTTLIHLLAGLTEADTGEILADGRPIRGPSLERALIFQNYSLLPWRSARRNVELAVEQCHPHLSRREVAAKAVHYLEMVQLGRALDRKPAELSGGMRQRVSLARGLAMEPKILFLDEPLGALDALTRAELQEEFVRIQEQEKRTILMITNDVDEGLILADRMIPLTAGPEATLGESIPVTIQRPRNRKLMNHDPNCQRDRKSVLHFLLTHGPRNLSREKSAAPENEPDLEPAWEAAPS